MYGPSELTGALVLEVRTKFGLSRDAFSELAGFQGRSSARLNNIEKKDSWKPGDREAIARVLNGLEDGSVAAPGPTRQPRTPGIKSKPGKSTGAVLKPIPVSTITLTDGTTIPLDQLRLTPLDPDGCLPAMPVIATHDVDIEVLDVIQEDDQLVTVGSFIINESHNVVGLMPSDQTTHYARNFVFDVQPTPDVHAFSNSELQTWKKCRRKWWLAWYRRLQLQVQSFSDVRATGTRIHRALEAWYVPEGQPRVDPRTALERIVVEDWTAIKELAAKRNIDDDHLSALAVEFTSATNLERAMIEGYVQWLEETGVDADLRVIGSEQPLVVDTEIDVDLGARHGTTTRPIQLIGLLDTRVRRTTDNVRLFVDHKSVGDLAGPVATLPQSEQMLHYHVLEWLSSEHAEDRCDGALYNMIRRVKRSQRAKPPFYSRIEVRHNKYELDAYKRRMFSAASDIIRATERLDRGEHHLDVVYPSPSGDCTWSCDFFAVCNMLDDGSRAEDMLTGLYTTGNPRARYEKKG